MDSQKEEEGVKRGRDEDEADRCTRMTKKVLGVLKFGNMELLQWTRNARNDFVSVHFLHHLFKSVGFLEFVISRQYPPCRWYHLVLGE